MSTRFIISLLIYGIAQGFLFGVGVAIVLMTPMKVEAATLVPAAVAVSALLAIPVAWKIAPLLRSRHVRHKAWQREAHA